MSRFWSDHVDSLQPYVPGEQPTHLQRLLKLNTNEHPYGPSPRALQAMRDAVNDDLRLYPDYDSRQLCQAVATMHDLKPEQVLAGNGSDEILAHVFNAFFMKQGRPLLMPDITYSFYRTYCLLYQIPCKLIPLAEDFTIHPADYQGPHDVAPAGIIFANPNAPTGIGLSLQAISDIAAANPDTVVVVDEAYVDFGAESAIALLRDHDNIVVVQTLSKSRALAGIRVGFLIANAELVRGVQRVKDSFNSYPLDRVAQAGATAAILDETHFRWACRQVMDERESLSAELETLGFDVLPSMTNFLFVRHPRHDGAALYAALRERGILVRHFTNPRIAQFLRITVGTPDDSGRLCHALRDILEG